MRDLSNNLRFSSREDAKYSKDMEKSEDGESAKEEFGEVDEPYQMQMDEGSDSVEGEFGEWNEDLDSDRAEEGGDLDQGEFDERDESLLSD